MGTSMHRIILSAVLFLAFAAYGQKLVAIINTVDDEEPPIKNSELTHLTDRLREIAAKTLPQRSYAVMTQQSILSLFSSPAEMMKMCNESDGCLVKIGRAITADYIAQGRIGRFGDNLTIKVELYESEKGTLVSSFTGTSKDLYGLLSVLDEKAPEMFSRMPGVSGGRVGSTVFAGGISGLERAVDNILDFEKRYLVNLSTRPEGATLSFDGMPVAGCSKTPCRAELAEGKVRIIAALERYETMDTTVSVTHNNQNIVLLLKSNFGILEIEPAYSNSIGKNRQWALTINDKNYHFGKIGLSPREYMVKLSHECYESIGFKVGINKGSHEVFNMSDHIKLKLGGLVLSAERDGFPVIEPIFMNGMHLGETPFAGSVPLCSEILIGNGMEAVNVRLVHNEKVTHKHVMRSQMLGNEIYQPEPEIEQRVKRETSFWVAIALDVIGVAIFSGGIINHRNAIRRYDEYRSLGAFASQKQIENAWEKVESAKSTGNTLYVLGGICIAAGIGVHIWF